MKKGPNSKSISLVTLNFWKSVNLSFFTENTMLHWLVDGLTLPGIAGELT